MISRTEVSVTLMAKMVCFSQLLVMGVPQKKLQKEILRLTVPKALLQCPYFGIAS